MVKLQGKIRRRNFDNASTTTRALPSKAAARCRGRDSNIRQACASASTASPGSERPEEVTASSETPFVPTEERKKQYTDFLAETHKRELSGSENFDKSVLTLSSAGLGLSLTFLKDFASVGHDAFAWLPWLLYMSWIAFTLATLCTMASFLVSGKALECHKKLAYRVYMEGEDEAFAETNKWNAWTGRLNYASAGAFCTALILTTGFVISTLQGNQMASGQYKTTDHGTLEKKGLSVPTMQRPSSAPPPAQPPASAPSNGQSNGDAGNAGKQ